MSVSAGIGFITEGEIEEKRKARQEEWERVRKPEEPLEAPAEEPYDGRSLFDRLQEQKNLKQEEFEESKKLKNLVKVLDDDECEFLDYVDQARIDEEKRKRTEEARELAEFRNAVSQLREKSFESAIHQEIALGQDVPRPKKSSFSESDDQSIGVKRNSQSKLLAGLVVKRKLLSTSSSSDEIPPKMSKEVENSNSSISSVTKSPTTTTTPVARTPLLVSGILPGLASYGSSSSEGNSDSDQDD